VEDGDEIMLVTNGGQLIRCPVKDIRIAGRSTQGVTVFKTAKDEQVVSVEHISESETGDEDDLDAQSEEGVSGPEAEIPDTVSEADNGAEDSGHNSAD
jgi:DNA gyrase subunit A